MHRSLRVPIVTLVVTSLLLALAPQPLRAASGAWRTGDVPGLETSEVLKPALIILAIGVVVIVVTMVSRKNNKKRESEKNPPAAADSVSTGAWIPGATQSAPIRFRAATPASDALWQPRTWEGDLALARRDGTWPAGPSSANGGELVTQIAR